MSTTTTSPSDISYWNDHSESDLIALRDRYQANAVWMFANGGGLIAEESERLAASISAQLALRGA